MSKPAAWPPSARAVLCYAALAVVLLVLLHESIFMGKGLVPADAVLNYPPWNQKARQSNYLLFDQYVMLIPTQEFDYQHGGIPLWNPDICCGAPNLGTIIGAPLFPIRLLLEPLGPFRASGPSAFLKLWLAGCFTLLYVRLMGGSYAAGFLAGLAFSLSGFMIAWLGHPQVNSAMWLPLLLCFLEKSFQAGQENAFAPAALRAWCGFVLAFALMILGGHLPTVIHVAIVLALYFAFRVMTQGRAQMWEKAGMLCAALAIGLLLAAPQILPYLEYYRLSSSSLASAAQQRWSNHLSFSSLIHFLLPNVMGNPSAGFENLSKLLGWHSADNFNERTGYVGVLPLFLAGYGIAFRRCGYTKFFFLLVTACMLVILGVPPLPSLLRALPVLRDMNETRLLLIVGFSLAVLAGLGWDEFNRTMSGRRRQIAAAIGFLVLAGAALACFWRVIGPGLHDLDSGHWDFVRRQFFILGGGLGAILVLTLWPGQWKSWIPAVICLGWTAVDLLCFAGGYNPAISRDLYYPTTPAIEWLQHDHSVFRIFGNDAMPPNSAEVFGLSDVRGGDYMTVKRYEELVTGNAGDFFFYFRPTQLPQAYKLLNAKYFLSGRPLNVNTNLFELEYSQGMFIYRFKECLERALVVTNYQVEPDPAAVLARVTAPDFDPRQTLLLEDQPAPLPADANAPAAGANSVHIVSYQPDEVQIDASLPRPGYLLLLDTWFPGWNATVNGSPAPILRADYNFRAVTLPGGKSTVVFYYRPKSLRIGLYLCAAGLLALGIAWLQPWLRKSMKDEG